MANDKEYIVYTSDLVYPKKKKKLKQLSHFDILCQKENVISQ